MIQLDGIHLIFSTEQIVSDPMSSKVFSSEIGWPGLGLVLTAALFGILIGSLVAMWRMRATVQRTRRQCQAALGTNAELHRLIAERSPDLITLADQAGRIRYASPAAWSIFGCDPTVIIGQMVSDRVHPDDVTTITTHLEDVLVCGTARVSVRYRHADHSWRWMESYSVRSDDNDGPIILTLSRDITEPKRLEADLLHRQKLETIGRAVGGVAHDFNNLLMGIAGFAELAILQLPPQHAARIDLEEILTSVSQGSMLTRQLRALARRHSEDTMHLPAAQTLGEIEYPVPEGANDALYPGLALFQTTHPTRNSVY